MLKRKLLMLLALVAAVLVCTSALMEAHAEDTYNFYFQKAPGPVTVNQGVAPAAPAVSVKTDPLGQATSVQAPAPASVAQAAAIEEPSRGVRALELSLGFSGSKHSGGGSDNAYYWQPQTDSGMYNAGQATLGLQWNVTPYFALQAEGFYLPKNPEKTYNDASNQKITVAATGSRLDYGMNLVITPFRLGTPEGAVKITGSLIAGAMSVPFLRGDNSVYRHDVDGPLTLAHAGSFHYGARLGLDFGRVALNATVRRIDRFSSTQGTAALVIAL